MKVLILSLLVLSVTTYAAEKKIAVSTSKKSTSAKEVELDAKSAKDDIVDETATLTDKHSMKAHVICKAKDGHELKQGDAGYDACIQKVKADKNTKSEPNAEVEVKLEK